MYSHNNPYAQAGWANTPSWETPSGSQPSVYGALPSRFDVAVPKEVAIGAGPLTFSLHKPSTGGYPSILNSTLVTPRDVPYLEIVTDRNTTYIRNLSNNTCIASIQWGSPATICITGIHSNGLPAGQWLQASSNDGGHMLLSQEGKQYKWMPQGHRISLYSTQGSVASIDRGQLSVTLHLTSEATVKVGMLPLVISTILLQSGRRFD